MKKMIVEKHIVIYFSELSKRTKPRRKRLDVFESHPVLIEFLVHSIHISDDTLGLH